MVGVFLAGRKRFLLERQLAQAERHGGMRLEEECADGTYRGFGIRFGLWSYGTLVAL